MDANRIPNQAKAPAADRDQSLQRQEEAKNCGKLPLLAAYGNEQLSVEAAQQLVRMSEDASYPVARGEDLPTADKAALLKKAAKAALLQKRS